MQLLKQPNIERVLDTPLETVKAIVPRIATVVTRARMIFQVIIK